MRCSAENDLESPLPEVEETGRTYEENALLKAYSGLKVTGITTVADDSGLSVDILDGAPGLYSARYQAAALPILPIMKSFWRR